MRLYTVFVCINNHTLTLNEIKCIDIILNGMDILMTFVNPAGNIRKKKKTKILIRERSGKMCKISQKVWSKIRKKIQFRKSPLKIEKNRKWKSMYFSRFLTDAPFKDTLNI